jgi:outer membrane immunogenic protein
LHAVLKEIDMKKFVFAASLLTLYPVNALAADMASKSLAGPIAALPSWAGFYLGIHGGYGWNDDDFRLQAVAGVSGPVGGIKSKGWIAGGHAGYNWQFGSVVAGVEGDFSATDIKGSSNTDVALLGGATFTSVMHADMKYLGSARARLGIAPEALGSNIMFYGTAGAAWERVNQTSVATNTLPVTFAQSITTPANLFGWVAGLGAEAKFFGSNWTARIEYLHYDFGSAHTTTSNINTGIPGFVDFTATAGKQTLDVVRAGVSYQFAADVTRY